MVGAVLILLIIFFYMTGSCLGRILYKIEKNHEELKKLVKKS